MWKGFGLKDMHSQQQGRPRELQAEPGKTGAAKREEEEEHWEELYLPSIHCGSRMLLMAGKGEPGIMEAGQRQKPSRE